MAIRNFSQSAFFLAFALLSLLKPSFADTQWIQITTDSGDQVLVPDNRKPALYTANFGDCLGNSLINVTRFDAAYYKDNMTVLFHLAGNTALTNASLMMYIGVFAYGESRFDLTFNPCSANINSLCPANASVPIQADGIIPVDQSDVAGIPPIALTIPDFEGEAVLRIFSNTTETEIGCFSAVITNGNSFSQPAAVGSVLGVFTFVALLASFATAAYGDSIPIMRKHYAHSLSILVVFAVWQHIFYTGALSMNWPSVLVAFWSNYAWAGGMIYSESMQNSINKFIGSNKGNLSMVGAASSGVTDESLGGGYDIHKIYGRDLNIGGLIRRSRFNAVSRSVENALAKRDLANSSNGYNWYGKPVKPGIPLPGNYSGFAGTLAQEDIPASNAFMTGFLWLLILTVLIAAAVVAFKWILEGLIRIKRVRRDRLTLFRTHWLGYTGLAVLRTLYIAFFMVMFLTLFQFTFHGSGGVVAIAAIVFLIFFIGMFGISAYACFYRIKFGKYETKPDRINLERRRVLGFVPWYSFSRASAHQNDVEKIYAGSFPFWRVSPADPETAQSIHDDEDYTKKFGWLASRFRRTRWWFFSVWLFYEFIRACFYAGASGHPLTQVFGLLVVEFIAFVAIIIMRPFEGQRLNAIVVYCLGFSKVASVALSAAFDVRFNLARIPTTAIGIVIIVIQGILTIILLVAIVLGAISSYLSVMRNRDKEVFRPHRWAGIRERYFKHLDFAEKDVPRPPPPVVIPEEPKYGFNVSSVRRMAKIEDEDPDFQADIGGDPRASRVSLNPLAGTKTPPPEPAETIVGNRRSRAASVNSQMSYTSLPFGARVHRASWSTRDFEQLEGRSRSRTAASTNAPLMYEDGNPNLKYMGSKEDVARIPSPLAGDVTTPDAISRGGSPLTRPKARTPDSHPTSPSSFSRPPLTKIVSQSEVELAESKPADEPSPGAAM